jgi:hypothetical protein
LAVEALVAVEEFSAGAFGSPGADLDREGFDAVEFGPVPGDC